MCGSFRADYLHPNYGWTLPASLRKPAYSMSPYTQIDRRLVVDTLSRHPQWLVVMRSVVVHASMRAGAASGLFGLLGDAPVQVLDIAEEDKIDALYKMARECQNSGINQFAQDLLRDTAHDLDQQLSEVLKCCYGLEKPSFRLRPAIMFHLCPLMCHQPGKKVDILELVNRRCGSGLMRDERHRWRGQLPGRGHAEENVDYEAGV